MRRAAAGNIQTSITVCLVAIVTPAQIAPAVGTGSLNSLALGVATACVHGSLEEIK